MVSYYVNRQINSLAGTVLILIVVDNGLVLARTTNDFGEVAGLNPYCSGQWSRTSCN